MAEKLILVLLLTAQTDHCLLLILRPALRRIGDVGLPFWGRRRGRCAISYCIVVAPLSAAGNRAAEDTVGGGHTPVTLLGSPVDVRDTLD